MSLKPGRWPGRRQLAGKRALLWTLVLGLALLWGTAPIGHAQNSGTETGGIGGTGISGGETGGIGGTGISSGETGGIGGTGVGRVIGGGVGGGVGSGRLVGFGTIQAFGSIILNGREYGLTSATIVTVDGKPAPLAALQIGERVLVSAALNQAGAAVAGRVMVTHAVTGPLTSMAGRGPELRMVVAGQTIMPAPGALLAPGLKPGDVVAVSAIGLGHGNWLASRIDVLPPGSEGAGATGGVVNMTAPLLGPPGTLVEVEDAFSAQAGATGQMRAPDGITASRTPGEIKAGVGGGGGTLPQITIVQGRIDASGDIAVQRISLPGAITGAARPVLLKQNAPEHSQGGPSGEKAEGLGTGRAEPANVPEHETPGTPGDVGTPEVGPPDDVSPPEVSPPDVSPPEVNPPEVPTPSGDD